MVRVMFYTGIAVVLVSAALLYLPICFSYILAVLFALFLIFLIVFRKKIKLNGIKALTVITLVFCITGIYTKVYKVKPVEQIGGYAAEVTATVTDWPDYKDNYTSYIITTESIKIVSENQNTLCENLPQKLKIRISDSGNNDLKVFDRFTAKIVFSSLSEYKYSSYSNGIYASGYIDEVSNIMGKNRPFYAVFYDLREYVNRLIYDNVNYDEASLASAVLIGDHSQLRSEFYNESKITGITHMIVVSGSHFGIIFQLLGAVLVFFRVPHRLRSGILIFSIAVVACVCGFSPSILRAAFTYFILAFGDFFFLRPDSLNSLGLAATVISFISPFIAGNVAFQLSFLSTFGLIFICPVIYERLVCFVLKFYKPKVLLKSILFSICQTLSATLMTLPVLILVYGYVSTVSLLANLITGTAMSMIMILTLAAIFLLALPFVFNAAAVVFTIPLCILVRYVKWVTSLLANYKYALLATDKFYIIPCVFMLLAIILVVLSCLSQISHRQGIYLKRAAAISSAICIVCFTVMFCCTSNNKVRVLDVGKGSSMVVSVNDTVVVIGAGDDKNDADRIVREILAMGKKECDYLILPNLNKNISGGAAAFIRQFPNTEVILPKSGEYFDDVEYLLNGNGVYLMMIAICL